MEQYLTKNWDTTSVQADIKAINELAKNECKEDTEIQTFDENEAKSDVLRIVIGNVIRWMNLDKKVTFQIPCNSVFLGIVNSLHY